jgi:trehalose 6-phosphate synthase/phosphatase
MEQAMLKAITLDESGQQAAISAMQEVIMKNDVTTWAKNFLNDVEDARLQIIDSRPSMLGYDDKQEIFNAYREARKRLILLDYDGTLIPFYLKPQEAVPGDVIKELVKKLAGSSRNDVVLISGRDAETLENWFKSSKIGIVAEHGAMYKRPDQQNWISKQQDGTDWKENVKECIDKYLNLIPGSFIEEKKYSIAWHYRAIENIDEESIRLALSKELMLLNTNDQFDILHGNKVIEIKSNLTNKGKFVSELLDKSKYDFVLAIGDDMTDEDMFKVLTAQGQFSIKVGMGATAAKFNMPGVNNVLAFLEQLSRCKDTVTA